ncbi:unnamed protein product, partial [Scytosiphon promiscuus]
TNSTRRSLTNRSLCPVCPQHPDLKEPLSETRRGDLRSSGIQRLTTKLVSSPVERKQAIVSCWCNDWPSFDCPRPPRQQFEHTCRERTARHELENLRTFLVKKPRTNVVFRRSFACRTRGACLHMATNLRCMRHMDESSGHADPHTPERATSCVRNMCLCTHTSGLGSASVW